MGAEDTVNGPCGLEKSAGFEAPAPSLGCQDLSEVRAPGSGGKLGE